jgi:uncharacterized lipoprotein YddW (UPF0748 family)
MWLTPTLLLALAASAWPQAFPIAAIDPGRDSEFPGGRERDQLIICTPEGGHDTTGTDVLGDEAIVVGGVVVHLGGNDSEIPENGYVVSGNGSARNWIVRNLSPGTAVAHDDDSIWIDQSFAGVITSMRWRLTEMESRAAALESLDDAEEQAGALSEEVEELENPLVPLQEAVAALDHEVFNAELAAMPSPANEIRAVWLRLDHSSPEYIADLAQALADAHVNAIFPEVDYGSVSIYPDSTGFFPQVDGFEGQDSLAILIEECHARGIEVHAWVHNFFVGGGSRTSEAARWAEAHPEWVSVNRRGDRELVPWGYRYRNPAHLELHDALIAAHVALVSNYDLDGYHYDHIRYCLSLSWESSWDFSDYTRARVREELGFDPIDITPDANPEDWARWVDWRQEQVTRYVRRNTEAIRAAKPGIYISAAVFPDLEAAISNKGQNWGAWVDEGLLDAAIPMIYTPSVEEVTGAVTELKNRVPPGDPVVIGLGPYLGFTPRLLVDQIAASRAAGATGTCSFVWHRFTEPMTDALVAGPWRSDGAPDWGTRAP